MKTLGPLLLLLSMTAAAQTPPSSGSGYLGQSWIGLLVPADCSAKPATSGKSKATLEADDTVTSRTTTPQVDQGGTRGSSTEGDSTSQSPTSKGLAPRTGDVTMKAAGRGAAEWNAAHKQALGLSATCIVGPGTTQFALLLPDGSTLKFDALANQAIQKKLPAFPSGATQKRVLRVSVQGKLQNSQIALDSIQM